MSDSAFSKPWLRSHLTQRYGASFLPADMTIQDWGVTFDDLEPHYDAFEYLCGTSGQAGNLKGAVQSGGNPFEGPRSRPYPTPPQKQPYAPVLWAKAAQDMGYHPFPQPSGNLSQAYNNPLGVELGPCTYCGFCEWFGCANYTIDFTAFERPGRTDLAGIAVPHLYCLTGEGRCLWIQ